MRSVVQRVSRASVAVGGRVIGSIGAGFAVLVGVATGDTAEDADYLARKIIELRVFEDSAGKMNLSLADVGGSILAISQFTLLADCRKGRRPSFIEAAAPAVAKPLFDRFVESVRSRGIAIQTGEFGADMLVEIHNDGPVTLVLESSRGERPE
jgi:D-tyrosyl-tRNA(Tyr) deacylase